MIHIIDLPLEIRQRIAFFVPITDCHNLAVSHRLLQDAAESRIWSSVSILTYYDRPRPQPSYNEDSSDEDDLVQDDISSIFKDRYGRLARAIECRPRRALQIKDLDSCFVGKLDNKLREILEKSARSLRTLSLVAAWRTIDGPDVLVPLVKSGSFNPFDRVVSFTLSLSTDWTGTFKNINKLFPSLHTLRLQYCSCPDPEQGQDQGIDRWSFSPDIRHVELVNMASDSRYLLPRLIRSFPGLKRLKLDTRNEWMSSKAYEDEARELVKVMKQCEKLETMEYATDERPGMMYRGSAILVLFDGTGWDDLKVLIMGGGIEMESETYIENIHLPNAPTVQTVIIPCRTKHWCSKIKNDLGKAPPPHRMIASSTIQQLRECSSLLRVVFGVYAHDPPLDSDKWCNNRISGVLIRSYTDSTGAEIFFHLRRLQLIKSTPKVYIDYGNIKSGCTGKDHEWIDHTWYKGYRVVDDTLDKVYKEIGGEGRGWITPGRGLTMSDKAWRVLQRGLKQAMRA